MSRQSQNKPETILALDIGGANLKAVHSDGHVLNESFELWKYPSELGTALAEMIKTWSLPDRVLLTMTGELCDCFESRSQGVRHIWRQIALCFPNVECYGWSLDSQWLVAEEVDREPLKLAASNWHALASSIASHHPEESVFVVDVGSTTTDLTLCCQGRVLTCGDDHQRLRHGQLYYQGVRRTSLMAVRQEVFFQGSSVPVMAEHFATMDDVLIVLEVISENDAKLTADGRSRTRKNSSQRILKMIGMDWEDFKHEKGSMHAAKEIAEQFLLSWTQRLNKTVEIFWRHHQQDCLPENIDVVYLIGEGTQIIQQNEKVDFLATSEFTGKKRLLPEEYTSAACAWALLDLWPQTPSNFDNKK